MDDDIAQRLQEAELLLGVAQRLSRTLDPGELLQDIVKEAAAVIPQARKSVIHLLDKDGQMLVPKALSSYQGVVAASAYMRVGYGVAGLAVQERRVVYVPDTLVWPQFVRTGSLVRSLLVVPLMVEDRSIGCISLDSENVGAFMPRHARVLIALGQQAAISIQNAQVTASLRQRTTELEDAKASLELRVAERTQAVTSLNLDLETAFAETVRLLTDVLELHEADLSGHSRRVGAGAVAVADRLRLPPEERSDVETAATLHDIGKLGIPEEVLQRSGRVMAPDELATYRHYPVLGEMVLQGVKRLKRVSQLIRHHRENYNGTGFPDGLTGPQIPLGARIIAVADVYDETKDRDALEVGRGNRFDPAVVTAFLQYVDQQARQMSAQRESRVKVAELQEKMILTRDLYTRRGLLLAPTGKVLDAVTLAKITNFHRADALVEPIHVRG
jgi:HD-GYP domain-containing protein (c-di-GMP phosphodiesterase class II)